MIFLFSFYFVQFLFQFVSSFVSARSQQFFGFLGQFVKLARTQWLYKIIYNLNIFCQKLVPVFQKIYFFSIHLIFLDEISFLICFFTTSYYFYPFCRSLLFENENESNNLYVFWVEIFLIWFFVRTFLAPCTNPPTPICDCVVV